MALDDYNPYCGPAPAPIDLWSSWNLDPILLVLIAAFFFALLRYATNRVEKLSAVLVLIVAAIAFISPLCALTSALFSARGLHHIITVSVLAPLIVLASRSATQFWQRICLIPPEGAFLASTAIFWLWHFPFAYSYALSGTFAYWLMQGMLLLCSLLLWAHLLQTKANYLTVLTLSVGTMIQMGFLSALLTFAPYPLFDEHLASTVGYGLSALGDQQLAGLIMWTFGLLPYLYLSISGLKRFLNQISQVED